jgi:pimeloyl-ACP methyl ester carboxylesterase
VANPASGVGLPVTLTIPRAEGRRPLVVLVPGGISSGSLSFGVSGIADRYARRGYAVAFFDPDGRGASSGAEDYGGAIHQAGLAAVVARAAELPAVDPDRVAVVSFSSGGVMAAGLLAAHPELPIRLYVGWEGPALRQHVRRILTTKDADRGLPPLSDDAWWAEREAAPFLRQISVPYLRIQSSPDHAQAHLDHARAMIRSATAAAHGGEGAAPWTRLNGNPPNRLFDSGFEPDWLPSLPAEVAVYVYLAELLPAS